MAEIMGYGDWTQIEIHNNCEKDLVFRNCQLSWGKFYESPNKDKEITVDKLNGTVIRKGSQYTIGACGRENTWSGCQGQFDLHDGTATAVTIKFYSPHGTSYNAFSMDTPTQGYYASQTGAYLGNDGPLGAITVKVVYKAPVD